MKELKVNRLDYLPANDGNPDHIGALCAVSDEGKLVYYSIVRFDRRKAKMKKIEYIDTNIIDLVNEALQRSVHEINKHAGLV